MRYDVNDNMPRNGNGTGANAADSIKAIARDLSTGSSRKSAHLVNLSIASLKHLVLYAESDDIRFRASEALLGLSPVRRKLDLLAGTIEPPTMDRTSENRSAVLGRRLKRLLEAGANEASEALRLIEQAEKEAGLTANPREPHPNSKQTKPVR